MEKSTQIMRATKNDRRQDLLDENFIIEDRDEASQWLPENESLAPSPGCRAETYQVWSL